MRAKSGDGEISFKLARVFVAIDCPVCADAEFFVSFNEQGKAVAVTPIKLLEVDGVPINTDALYSGVVRRLNDGVAVDGISGATKTNVAYRFGAELIEKVMKAQ